VSPESSPPSSSRPSEDAGILKHQIENLERDVQTLKTESQSWLRTWGVYLGIMASLFAVPRAAKELVDSYYQHPKFSVVAPVPLTLFYEAGRHKLTCNFPVVASNYGNRGGVILSATAHLEPPSIDAAAADITFVDEARQPIQIPFPVPVGVLKSVTGTALFKGNNLLQPGKHRLNVTLVGEDKKLLPLSFCFDVNPDLVEGISQEPLRLLNTPCE
jgi:hypothetical protein